jgi:hypothetical protein
MLDEDLAEMYGVLTKRLNEQVLRNINRFPLDFMFPLTFQEVVSLRSQIVTSNPAWGGRRKLPLVFTEQGVAMLSSVLSSERAIQVNIAIMRAFVQMRRIQISDKVFEKKIDELEGKYARHEHQFKVVFDAIRKLMTETSTPRKRILGPGDKPE